MCVAGTVLGKCVIAVTFIICQCLWEAARQTRLPCMHFRRDGLVVDIHVYRLSHLGQGPRKGTLRRKRGGNHTRECKCACMLWESRCSHRRGTMFTCNRIVTDAPDLSTPSWGVSCAGRTCGGYVQGEEALGTWRVRVQSNACIGMPMVISTHPPFHVSFGGRALCTVHVR